MVYIVTYTAQFIKLFVWRFPTLCTISLQIFLFWQQLFQIVIYTVHFIYFTCLKIYISMYHDAYWCKSLDRYTDFDYVFFSIISSKDRIFSRTNLSATTVLFYFCGRNLSADQMVRYTVLPYGMSKPGPNSDACGFVISDTHFIDIHTFQNFLNYNNRTS